MKTIPNNAQSKSKGATTMNTRYHFNFLVLLLLFGIAACSGGGGGGSTPPANTAVYPRFAYVADAGDNSVLTYVVDAATGRLKFTGKVAA